MNAANVWTSLRVTFAPCSLPIASRMNFPFPRACLFLLECLGFLPRCQGTIENVPCSVVGISETWRRHLIRYTHTLVPWASPGLVPCCRSSQEKSFCSVVTCSNILICGGQPMPGHEVRTAGEVVNFSLIAQIGVVRLLIRLGTRISHKPI